MISTVFLLFFFSLSTLNKEIIIIILRFYKDKYTVSSQPQSHLEMWEWGTSVRRKKGSIFILHLFCSLWHNFEEQMIELPKFLVQFKHNTVFQCCKITSCLSISVLHVFNHSFKRIFAKYGKYTDLQSNFSDKNIWRSSKVFQGIAFPKFRGYRSVLKCHRMWLFDCNFLSKPSSLPSILRRLDFQVKVLKEIHNNYPEL